ncbi:glycosyl hydrolase [Croceivirga radicis]|uniref:glycosyl hydrolase n=1 Tax=Croceivirga radicis TaxID=1929488 RepID=UPI000255AD55|nr:glycosyl hydrolase [Croceivirga radicis]
MGNTKIIFLLSLFTIFCYATSAQMATEPISTYDTTKPWTRWWWMGSAVDKPNITQSLIDFKEKGIGGVEIAPIYGIQGKDSLEIDYLSYKWVQLLQHTIRVADSLGLGVDFTLGTGWPYGGPQVEQKYAATKLHIEKYEIAKNTKKTYELHPDLFTDKKVTKLLAVIAKGHHTNRTINLKVDAKQQVRFKAKQEPYTLYAFYEAKTGQVVKRAAPGAGGFTLDHYSNEALLDYIIPFNSVFDTIGLRPRAIFNDSYEVYGTDFTPNFLVEFKIRRGYDLANQLLHLIDTTNNTISNRVKADYRRTLGDLLLEEFDLPWTKWANNQKMKTKLQAHGSPGNLLDLYAASDIPECETFGSMPYEIPNFRRLPENIREGDANPMMLKFSSSAGHIANKKLISSETFTWLRDHFKTALAHCKPEVEDLFLNGINHVFLHGSTYSPTEADWPGYKFYASVNFNRNNTIWEHADGLFSYIQNCQRLLQKGSPNNDVLVYWPIHDVWHKSLNNQLFFQFKIHSLDEWLLNTSFYRTATQIAKEGFSLDFISDRWLEEVRVENNIAKLPGGNYKAIVVPATKYIPLETLKKLLDLKKQGVPVLFMGKPESVPGFYEYQQREKELEKLIDAAKLELVLEENITKILEQQGIQPESLAQTGLKFIRRKFNDQDIYYLVNHTNKTIDAPILFSRNMEKTVLYDPQLAIYGSVQSQNNQLRIQLNPGQSIFVINNYDKNVPEWIYKTEEEKRFELTNWSLEFTKGGPTLPSSRKLDSLKSWTNLDAEATQFSGTAKYSTTFELTNKATKNYVLDLGDVRESAKVWVNNEYIGTAWHVPFNLPVNNLKQGTNTITIEVANLPANRIRAKALNGEKWQIFKEINMVNKDYKPLETEKWKPVPSGLLGPVTLIELK